MRALLLAALLALPARAADVRAFEAVCAPPAFAAAAAGLPGMRRLAGSPEVSLGPLWQAASSLFTPEGAMTLAAQAGQAGLPREESAQVQRRWAQAQAAAARYALVQLNVAARAALDSEVPAGLVARFQKDAAGYAIYGPAVESRWRAVGKLLAMRQDAKVAALLKDPFDRKDENLALVPGSR